MIKFKYVVKVYDGDRCIDDVAFSGKNAVIDLIKWLLHKYASITDKIKNELIDFM